ncbi:GCN5-related N-acetyltransferase [Lachnospiraceae bacterium KM106-2]|nr:GCN5-related N-acetyltransferase [Lachnospiraceae bacterium KM106-2]
MNNYIKRLEEYAMNAFPAITTNLYDGWILRFSNGYTYRGNCITPLYPSTDSLETKIKHCEDIYRLRNQPAIFKLAETMNPDLDPLLVKLGYQRAKDVIIMTQSLSDLDSYETELVHIEHYFLDQWLKDFCILNNTTDSISQNTIAQSFHTIETPVYCASIYQNGEMVACGLGVKENDHIGLFDIRVKDSYRRQGFATKICAAILKEGQSDGATTAYLQVASANQIARNLYSKLGFHPEYTYWYQVKEF